MEHKHLTISRVWSGAREWNVHFTKDPVSYWVRTYHGDDMTCHIRASTPEDKEENRVTIPDWFKEHLMVLMAIPDNTRVPGIGYRENKNRYVVYGKEI